MVLQAGGGGVSEQDRLSAELQILHVVHSSKTMVDSCTSECLPISTTSVIVEHHLSVLQVLRAVVLSPSPGRPLLLPEAIQQFELVRKPKCVAACVILKRKGGGGKVGQ